MERNKLHSHNSIMMGRFEQLKNLIRARRTKLAKSHMRGESQCIPWRRKTVTSASTPTISTSPTCFSKFFQPLSFLFSFLSHLNSCIFFNYETKTSRPL